MDDASWTGRGKVRAREDEAGLVIVVDGLTSQAKYYKPLIYEFFRKEWRASRPAWRSTRRRATWASSWKA